MTVPEATVTKLDETTLLECVDVMDTLPLRAELGEELWVMRVVVEETVTIPLLLLLALLDATVPLAEDVVEDGLAIDEE